MFPVAPFPVCSFGEACKTEKVYFCTLKLGNGYSEDEIGKRISAHSLQA
jgi:hypothetical protein